MRKRKGRRNRKGNWCRWSVCSLLTVTLLLSGCARVTEEMEAGRLQGISLLESGDYEGAIAQFEQVISQSSRVTEFELDVLKYRAEAELGLEDYTAAAYTYEMLSQVDKPKPEYSYLRAMCLAKSNDTAGAEEALEEGRGLDENLEGFGYEEAMLALGEAYGAAGDSAGMDRIYQELISSGHENTEIYNRWMLTSMEAEDYEAALAHAETGLALSDDRARQELLFNQAVCYEYLGQYDKALELFQSYAAAYENDAAAEHEIAFLVTR